jgi:hypothetical protein
MSYIRDETNVEQTNSFNFTQILVQYRRVNVGNIIICSFKIIIVHYFQADDSIMQGTNSESVDLSTRPKQFKIHQEIVRMEIDLDCLKARKNVAVFQVNDSDILSFKVKLEKKRGELKCLQTRQLASQKYRKKEKKKRIVAQQICEAKNDSKTAALLSVQDSVGRPRIEDSQPGLMDVLVRIAIFSASAADKRRSEGLRSCRTLDDLAERLHEHGFNIARSTLYYRLLPKRLNLIDGKKHVKTVNVRLCRVQNDHHKNHPDAQFTIASIHAIEEIASLLGAGEVCFISQDDKARVPIGLTAIQKQAPLLMHLEYRVRLPDHDWVIASKHKLIPSVYGGCVIGKKIGDRMAVSYSGPTHIAIR